MEYAVFFLGLLAIVHFIYEGIVAPSYRLEQRYKLFGLRDELRMLKIRQRDGLPGKHFHYLQDAINGLIRNIERIDVTMLIALTIKRRTDKEFRERMEARAKTLDDCHLREAMDIRARGVKIIEHALSANNGAWVFYIIPIAIAIACYKKTARAVKSIMALSEPDIEKVAVPSPQRRLTPVGRH